MTTFVLAMDHRVSLRKWLQTLDVPAADTDRVARRLKTLCMLALAAARDQLEADETPMLLVDEEYGVDAIPEARARALKLVVAVERSGDTEFHFEHGDEFGAAIEAVDPFAVKALVRYNPAGDAEANRRSRRRLVLLQDYLGGTGRPLMLELLVPATAEQMTEVGGDDDRFDDETRPGLAVAAIDEIAADGLRPQWWKLEGQREPAAATLVAAAASRASEVGSLVLGRGQDRERVIRWVEIAAAVDGFTGFAVGRTLWTDPFAALVAATIGEDEAVGRIAAAYLDMAATYRRAQRSNPRQPR